jgi:hypothetical protein
MTPFDWLPLCAGAFLAGLVDAVVGGGGLIQIPLLFNALPNAAPATLFGTNKMASVFGTGSAAWRYARRVAVPWRAVLPAAVSAFVLSYAGAMTVAILPPVLLRPVVLALLIAVAAYTYLRKDFGAADRGWNHGPGDGLIAVLVGGLIGFYDGFFGPGTGSFLIFLFIRFFGLDFLQASAGAKVVNASTNVAALLYFGPHGNLIWPLGLAMALFNITGAVVGTNLALRHGAGFVRRVFLFMAVVLILKFAYDTVVLNLA